MTILIALLWDWVIGEPPLWCHPVVWFGNYLKLAEKLRGRGWDFWGGALTWTIGVAIVVLITWCLTWAIGLLPLIGRIGLTGLLLKPTFAFRMLVREVLAIETALQRDLDQGRQRLAYIVSRNTTNLSAIEVRESALESISENLSDSVIAPLFWFLIGGLPGAYVYRLINTADAMWGYRNETYEWWGKWAAKADDIANWIPARLTGLWLYYFPLTNRPAICILRQEAHKTPSPNSGWSMAAFALRLNVHLGKPGVYILNEKGNDLDAAMTIAGIHWITRAGWGLTMLLALISLWRFELI